VKANQNGQAKGNYDSRKLPPQQQYHPVWKVKTEKLTQTEPSPSGAQFLSYQRLELVFYGQKLR
jgi:hypothetical protein